MDLQGKKLLILGGTTLSCEIIKQAQRQGAYVMVTDYLMDSPGKKIADKSFLVSTTDVEAVLNLIKNEKIDGVLTGFIDSMLPYYQLICEKAGLACYGTKKQFDITTNKAKFKNLCRNFNVPVVEEVPIPYPFSLKHIENIAYPVLVKPVDYSGTRGVFICENSADLLNKYEKSLVFSPSKRILVESYMTAQEVHIHYLVQDGEICLSAMADRHMKSQKPGIIPLPVAIIYPSKHLKSYRQNLAPKVLEMLKSIGIQNGMILIQAFVEEDNFIFYDIGYRLNGTMEYKIIQKQNGINPMEMMVNYALTGLMYGEPVKPILNPDYSDWGFSLAFIAKPGRVGKILGVEKVMSYPGVIDVVPFYFRNDLIPESAIGTLKQIIFKVYATAKSKVEMAKWMDKIKDSIKVFSADGENMLLDCFDTRELFE